MSNIATAGPRGSDKTPSILLAEDNPANLMIARTHLEKAGYTVDTVGDGIEAVEAMERNAYDLILMDISMPHMDGLEATAAIRGLDIVKASVPVVAMTAHVLDKDREMIFEAGLDDFLAKPFAKVELIDIVERWTGEDTDARPEPEIGNPEVQSDVLLDPRVLEVLSDETGPELMPRLIETFLVHSRDCAERISTATGERDIHTLQKVTHSLGSSAATYGAMSLHFIAREIETACRNGKSEVALALAGQVGNIVNKTWNALERHLELNFLNSSFPLPSQPDDPPQLQ
ncbi:MAG: response regulator [Rhodospirillales bacterium]|nr:response regulator [Rhodospirillales bacterium]